MSFDGQGAPAGPERFTETAVLFAVMNGDNDGAAGLIGTMMDGELNDYYRQVAQTLGLVAAEIRSRLVPGGLVIR